MTADLRARVEALIATAGRMTEGPWRAGDGVRPIFASTTQVVGQRDGGRDFIVTSCNHHFDDAAPNATDIAALRSDAPGLLV